MPIWIERRANHLMAKNPSMEKGTAFAIATMQSHAKGKSPKGYGTAVGRREAKAKYNKPKKSYEGKANPGNLESPKMGAAFFDEFNQVMNKAAEDKIPGGKADIKTDADFPKDQLDSGQQVELEHTDNPDLAREIARDHLTEFSDYYTRLKRMEDAAKMDEEGKTPTKKASAFLDEIFEITKAAFLGGRSDYSLLSQLGKPKVREQQSMAPSENFRVKEGMLSPGPFQSAANPQNRLARSQRVGTLEDPKGTQFKPLHMIKPPKVPTVPDVSGTSSTSTMKLGTSLFSKLAFGSTGFGGTGGVWRPKYTSVVQPIQDPPLSVLDPNLKQAGEQEATIDDLSRFKKALMKKASAQTPAGQLSSSRLVGAPKQTGFSGPSISDISKPVGFGKVLPGTAKNRI